MNQIARVWLVFGTELRVEIEWDQQQIDSDAEDMDVINGLRKSIQLLTPDGVDATFRHWSALHFVSNSW